jgi:hypothetical protein
MYNQTSIFYCAYTLDENKKQKFIVNVEINGIYKPENLSKAIEKINAILTTNPKYAGKYNGKNLQELGLGIMVKKVDFRGSRIMSEITIGYPIKAENDNRNL